MNLTNRQILLGVTGGIAAYKSADLCRNLVKAGAQVRVVMTAGARAFINPLTFQALSHNPVHTELLDSDAEAGMGHIELAKWAQTIIIAPASADFIARFYAGMADDLLSTIMLATDAQVYLAPAMNQAMWKHPATQRNLSGLEALLDGKLQVLGPQDGEQACGDVGPGRMMEPADMLVFLQAAQVGSKKDTALQGLKVVITAGPTREAIDPVRYISNHSSGKMGYAIADECYRRGADVTLISGPVSLAKPEGINVINVVSAQDMYNSAMDEIDKRCDLFIASAAVADYRPDTVANSKIKKSGNEMHLSLTQNPDIVASVGHHGNKPFTVGFAAETNDVEAYAKSKLEKKKLDLIVANDVSNSEIGFNSDNNEISLIWSGGVEHVPIRSKKRIAEKIVEKIIELK